MAARGKYKPEIVEDILFAIAQTGRDADGIEAGGISQQTFYKWIREKAEFSEGVAHAKRTWRYKLFRDDPGIVRKARERLIEALDPTTEKWSSTKKLAKTIIVENPDYPNVPLEEQKLLGVAKREIQLIPIETTEKTVIRPPAYWAIRMVLGPDGRPIVGNNPEPNQGDDFETVDFEFRVVESMDQVGANG